MTERYGIPGNERAIIICGMARSGTTIFTHALCSHNRIALYRDGPESWLLENDCLPNRGVATIQRALGAFPSADFVVFKRPWIEQQYLWLATAFPRARFIVLRKDRDAITKSWERSPLLDCHPESRERPVELYELFIRHTRELARLIGRDRFQWVEYEDFLADPGRTLGRIAGWLNLPTSFDTSAVVRGGQWVPEMASVHPLGV